MRSFECLITDDRSAVPQLTWLVVSDVERASELVRRDLINDEHYQAVELREKGALVFSATRAQLLQELEAAGMAPAEGRSFGKDRR